MATGYEPLSSSRQSLTSRLKTVREFSTPEAEIHFLESKIADLEALQDGGELLEWLGAALDLGIAYYQNGQMDEAEPVLERVRSQMLKVWQWDHITPHICVKTLKAVLISNEKWDVAFNLHIEALHGVRRILGSEHPWTLQYQNNLGYFYVQKKEWYEAGECFLQAANSKQQVFGADHYSTLNSLHNIDLVSYLRDGDLALFEIGLLSRLNLFRKIYGDQTKNTEYLAKQLLSVFFMTGNIVTAQQLCRDLNLDIESAAPFDERIDIVHLDDIIPVEINIRIRQNGLGAVEAPGFLARLTRVPKVAHLMLSSVAWTREKVMTWAGLNITELAKLMKLPNVLPWSEFDDVTTMLRIAAELGHAPTISSFLEQKNKDAWKENRFEEVLEDALRRASMHGNETVVRLILDKGTAVNATNPMGQSALHQAAQRGQVKVAMTLLEFGADPICRDKFGLTPLDDGLKEVHHSIVRLLMEFRGALVASFKQEKAHAKDHFLEEQISELEVVGLQSTSVCFYIDKSNPESVIEEHRVYQELVESLISGLDTRDEGSRRVRSRSRSTSPQFRWDDASGDDMVQSRIAAAATGAAAGTGQTRGHIKSPEDDPTVLQAIKAAVLAGAVEAFRLRNESAAVERSRKRVQDIETSHSTRLHDKITNTSRGRQLGRTRPGSRGRTLSRPRPVRKRMTGLFAGGNLSPASHSRLGGFAERDIDGHDRAAVNQANINSSTPAREHSGDRRDEKRSISVSSTYSGSSTITFDSRIPSSSIPLQSCRIAGPGNYPSPDFKWIHLPANNVRSLYEFPNSAIETNLILDAMVEALMAKLQAKSTDSRYLDLLKEKLWRGQQHQSVSATIHGRFMHPSCRVFNGENDKDCDMILFMPYIHWEAEPEIYKLQTMVDRNKPKPSEERPSRVWSGISSVLSGFSDGIRGEKSNRWEVRKREEKVGKGELSDRKLIQHYLNSDPPLHIRRTLDQFHYFMTEDTTDRDSDQVIGRYFKKKFPKKPKPIMMVDQLWLWIINGETVITSFPQRWGQHVKSKDEDGTIDMTNVLDSVLKHLQVRERDPITSAFDLAELIVGRCLGLNYDAMEWAYERYPYLEIFDYSINSVADQETTCFNTFADRGRKYSTNDSTKQKENRKRKRPGPLGNDLEDIFDISQEIDLLKEIKDIRDELNIMRHLFDQQKRVLETFCPAIKAASGHVEEKPKLIDAVERQAHYVESLDEDAKRPYKALEDLLDLKQKQANVSEARSTRISGNTITVFTIVTIIFLPASFMASFFALPITQYPKINQNFDLRYVIKYLVATTVALAVPFIILALYVNPIIRIFKASFRSSYKTYIIFSKISISIFKISKQATYFLAQMIWWQLKNLDKPTPFLVLGRLSFRVIWIILVNWKVAVMSLLHYRKAKKTSREQGTEWSKRRFVIGELVKRRREKMAEDEEKQNVKIN